MGRGEITIKTRHFSRQPPAATKDSPRPRTAREKTEGGEDRAGREGEEARTWAKSKWKTK